MDIDKIIVELRKEREQLDAAIASLTRLGMAHRLSHSPLPKKRGRPVGSKNKKASQSE